MSKLKFTPGMFFMLPKEPYEAAQQIFDEWLEKQKVVYSRPHLFGMPWLEIASELDTHRARLVCVEEIQKKECKHIPYIKYVDAGVGVYPGFAMCEKCGIKLKASWSPA